MGIGSGRGNSQNKLPLNERGRDDAVETFDAIILGGGHNSLVLQAYLARAGLETLCLDCRDVAGGGLTTIEQPAGSGFWHNTHSYFHRGITQLPWYIDLELARLGAKYVEPSLNATLVCSDGRTLQWWTDFEKTAASIEQFSKKDAARLRQWRDRFVPIVKRILTPEAQSPPFPADLRRNLLEQSEDGRLLLETSALSPLEFSRREFEHPTVQAALLFFNGLREVDLRCRGFGHHIPALMAAGRMAQMCIGGSRRLADALVAAVEHSGGKIRLNTAIQRIVIENDRAVGVETVESGVLRARKLVASGLNPQQTFLELIDSRYLPTQWVERAREYRYNLLAPLFAVYLNLNEPPQYAAASNNPELDDSLMVILGIEDTNRFDDIVRHHESGSIPPTVMWGSSPTKFDPTQAPSGKHTAFMWEKVPFRIQGSSHHWEKLRDKHARQMIEFWARYAPNLDGAIIDWFATTPLDTLQTLPNMHDGDLLVGSLAGGQVGFHRPFPGAGHYRGHLQGLYLCGSCCHPGGNITGLPGYNAAQVILADLEIAAPWAPPPIQQVLESFR